jgi:hypothetical protein
MKNALLFFCLMAISTQINAQTPSVKEDEEAIKKVIVEEFDALFTRGDYDAWAATHVDAPYTTSMMSPANNPGGLVAVSDFKTLSAEIKSWVKPIQPGAKPGFAIDSRGNWLIHINGNMAFAVYDEVFLLGNGTKIKAKTQKVMERIKGQWKIASTAVIGDFNNAIIPSPNPEEEAIKKVVIAETDAYCKRDYQAWADTHLDAPTTTSMMTPNGSPGSLGAGSDFQKMSKGTKTWMEASPQSEMQLTAPSDGWICRINGNMASISYNEYNIMVKTGAKIKSRELRVLEKINGQWKISAQSSIWDFKNTEYGTPNLEEEAIKKVIISETEYWLEGNYEKWAESFIQKPYFTWSVTNGGNPGDVITARGWDTFGPPAEKNFTNRKEGFVAEMRKSKTTRDKWNIQIRGNVAYVNFNAHIENEEKQSKFDATEMRVLERINGVWKIGMHSTLADFKDATPPIRSKY